MHPPSPSRRRRKPGATAQSRTTITSLGDDALTEILIRLPSLASLAVASLTCPRWHRLATSRHFLARFRARNFLACFRARHGFLPLLGCFFYAGNGDSDLPLVFHRARQLPDRDLAAVVRAGDFLLTSFFEVRLWRFKDFCQGRLLFAGDDELVVFNPVTRRLTSVPLPSASESGPHDKGTTVDCLLPACAAADGAFRVVCLNPKRGRAQEYSSRTGEWRAHEWEPTGCRDTFSLPGMHAAGRIYWKHSDKLLCLETAAPSGSLQVTHVALPPVPGLPEAPGSYVVGDTEDGACCVVCAAMSPRLRTHTLQLWLRREEDGGSWEFRWETTTIPGGPLRAVNAGVLLASSYMAFRLNELRDPPMARRRDQRGWEACFFAPDGSADAPFVAYPYVMAWPWLIHDDGGEARG